MQKAINFNDVAIVSIKRSDYRIHFWHISKDNAINIMENSNLSEKSGSLYFFSSLYIKMSDTTYYQRNRETMLKSAKDYYQNKRKY